MDKEKVVYTYAVADILHIGHLKYLQQAKEQGDRLIVGVLTDEACMEKKPRPIMSFEERLSIVGAIGCVDGVMRQDTYSPLDNVRDIRPDVLIESSSHDVQPASSFVESYGGKVIELPYYEGQSSTKIKQKICQSS